MSDEVRETQAGVAATVNENQEEQITKPAPKVKPQKEKDPKKVAAGKKLAEKNRQAKAALEREIKREIAEKEKENENSAGWLPEMSFQTVLSLVGVAFTAFELYQRFRPKSSSPRAEPKHSGGDRDAVGLSPEYGEAAATAEQSSKRLAKTLETSKSEGLSREPTSEES